MDLNKLAKGFNVFRSHPDNRGTAGYDRVADLELQVERLQDALAFAISVVKEQEDELIEAVDLLEDASAAIDDVVEENIALRKSLKTEVNAREYLEKEGDRLTRQVQCLYNRHYNVGENSPCFEGGEGI